MTEFWKLYHHYKEDWSMEMRLTKANMTYEELWAKSQQEQEWF